MQAIILAAGMGKRLGKYTKDNTKCMLKINNTTLIEHCLEKLNNLGITSLIMVIGYQRDNVIKFLGNQYKNIKIEYIVNDIYDRTNNIYSLYLAKDKLIEDDTLLLESDLIFEESIIDGVLKDKRKNLAVVDKFQGWMDGTVVKLDLQDNITDFLSKKSFKFSDIEEYYKTVNIYKFSKEFSQKIYVPFLEAYISASGHNEYYEQVLRIISILDDKGVQAYKLNGELWYEIDDVQDKDNAEVLFAPDLDLQLKLLNKRYGGYWRYTYIKDFCYLVNPYFPSLKLENEMKAYFHQLISQYPSGANIQNLLAGKMFNVDTDEIIVGNGASELIRAIGKVVEGTFGIVYPSFNEYEESIGIDRVIPLIADNSMFSYSIDDLIKHSETCDNLVLINPDNPTGHFINKSKLFFLLDNLKSRGKKIFIDESFMDFSEESITCIDSDILNKYPNLIVIKSIGKSYGVPGVRLGVLASSNKQLLCKIKKNLSIWNINSFGEYFLQIIGKYKSQYKDSCAMLIAERAKFFSNLQQIPFLRVLPSQANYFICEVLGTKTAEELASQLLSVGIYIKVLNGKTGIMDNKYIRLAVRDQNDNQALINQLKKCI